MPDLMAASQVDLKGKLAAAWRYQTRAPALGRSWELRAVGVVGSAGRMGTGVGMTFGAERETP